MIATLTSIVFWGRNMSESNNAPPDHDPPHEAHAAGHGRRVNAPSDSSVASGVWEALRSPVRMQMLEAICASPGIDARSLAEALESSPPRLHYHLNILVAAGLIETRGDIDRRNRRGPTAVGFVARFGALGGQFVAGQGVDRKGVQVVREVAESAFELVTGFAAGSSDGPVGKFALSHEALEPEEIEEVRAHIARIEVILAGARARRHRQGALVRATVFVGICLAAVVDPILPFGPVGWDLEDRIGRKTGR